MLEQASSLADAESAPCAESITYEEAMNACSQRGPFYFMGADFYEPEWPDCAAATGNDKPDPIEYEAALNACAQDGPLYAMGADFYEPEWPDCPAEDTSIIAPPAVTRKKEQWPAKAKGFGGAMLDLNRLYDSSTYAMYGFAKEVVDGTYHIQSVLHSSQKCDDMPAAFHLYSVCQASRVNGLVVIAAMFAHTKKGKKKIETLTVPYKESYSEHDASKIHPRRYMQTKPLSISNDIALSKEQAKVVHKLFNKSAREALQPKRRIRKQKPCSNDGPKHKKQKGKSADKPTFAKPAPKKTKSADKSTFAKPAPKKTKIKRNTSTEDAEIESVEEDQDEDTESDEEECKATHTSSQLFVNTILIALYILYINIMCI